MMKVPFDTVAKNYDSHFTHSSIGQLQRQAVWHYLDAVIPTLKGLEILELNCGTGEDAIVFGERGFNVVATDISQEMLNVTDQKARQYSMQHQISSRYLNVEDFDQVLFDKKFDLVFSNFGGLNCVHPKSFQLLLEKLPAVLARGGRFIAVIMPRFCIWESLYFSFKFQFKKVFRRASSSKNFVTLNSSQLSVWYYSPREILRWSKNYFERIALRPIGFALPPSYLEKFFVDKKGILNALNAIEKKTVRIEQLAGVSDHFIIDLKMR